MAKSPVLNGELGLLSLFDLGQLFMLNRTTGELSVTSEGRKGYFYFDGGQIVNAVDDEYHEGEGAAYRLFTWRTGRFEFRAEPPSGSPAIAVSTEGLMMEAARRMDESSAEGGGEGGQAEKLAQRASSLEALRDAFHVVTHEARSVPEPDVEAGGSPFALLRDPSDALLFRPGHLPRVRVGGRWRGAGSQPLDPAAFDQLRARLLDGVRAPNGGTARDANVLTCVVTHEDRRRYAVTRVGGDHEALWIRAAELAPADAAHLDGPLEGWRGLLAEPAGLLLVAGPDADAADRLFHACVAQIARTRGGAVLLAADHGRWRHADESGVLLRTAGAEASLVLRTLSPEVAAFDHVHSPASADALSAAPRVVAVVVASEAASALARWFARTGRHAGDGIEGTLGASVGVVWAMSRTPEGRVRFDVSRIPTVPALEPSGDGAAAGNPMAALAAELSRTLRKAA
ncbi:MAG TPA: DUF4388 domain-containing protein [Candidatus Acidoferrales bacterium]|nr:DUF4388 domain-containing protein [Candidatus Acidoferrales bacterium]